MPSADTEVTPAPDRPSSSAGDASRASAPDSSSDWRHPSLEAGVLLAFVIVAVRVGLSPLHDNSFLTHLATGRIILDTHHVPTHDPYSWTAHGHAWTVQSWGASVIYASAERWIGLVGIRLVDTACTVALVAIMWRLTRPLTGLVARLLVGCLVVAIGTGLWVERPLLFGAVALGLVLLAAEDQLDPRWLVPTMWIWVNTHGSFPFGPVVLVLLAFGRWLDERQAPKVELRALAWTVLGTALGAVGPIGWRILVFPFELLGKREAFAQIQEWQPMGWHSGVDWFFGVQMAVVAVAILVRHRRWRAIVPAVVFAAAAITSSRNILQASLVLTPIMAQSLAGLGRLDGRRRTPVAAVVAHALVLVIALSAFIGLRGPDTSLGPYPQDAVAYMQRTGLLNTHTRVVSRDFAGNYIEWRLGPDRARVFIDDRVDMYPLKVIREYLSLIAPGDHHKTLQDVGATAVLWDRDSDLGRWLEKSSQWQIRFKDHDWIVAVPRSTSTAAGGGT